MKLAEDLIDAENLIEEGRLRTSISRSYYGCFLIIRTLCERKGGKFDKNKQHASLRDYLKVLNHDFLANLLETLFDYRVRADYILSADITKELCKNYIELAKEIIEITEDI